MIRRHRKAGSPRKNKAAPRAGGIVNFRATAGERQLLDELRSALFALDRSRSMPNRSDVLRRLLGYAGQELVRRRAIFLRQLSASRQ